MSGVLVTTAESVPGYQTMPVGLVMDIQTLGLHVGRDILLRLTDWLGGRSRVIDKQAQVALEMAASRLVDRAKQRGADAVIATRLIIQPIGIKKTAMIQAVIYGTAVRLVPLASSAPVLMAVKQGVC